MQRVMLGQSSVPLSPKRKRLSVGFGVNASVQIHKTVTPPAIQQQRSISTHNDTTVVALNDATPSKRKNLHEALLMRLLSTPSDEPLFRQNSTEAPESQRTADESFDSCLSGRSTPIELDLLHQTPDAMRCNTPPAAVAATESAAPPNRHMQLLMRDFNSPSATARLRAVRALNSVSKRNAYGNFDISYAEQDIITAEERLAQEQRTIQDVLKDVCVYVEVRSGTDNRSEGIKEHIASLGAKVNERLLRDTTHVIFKDGLLSTYQKAKKMNIPIVSILWIEACKRHNCLMNPNDFKISNLERYENPDLFKRMRRQKSMQPGAEEAAGAKKRPNVTGKAKAAAAVISPPSKLPVLHRIRKDDRLERILSDFEAENQITSSGEGPVDEYDELLQAAPMRILERFRSTPTPIDREEEEHQTNSTTPITTTTNTETPQANGISTRRELFAGSKSITPRNRRKTVMFTPQMKNVQEEEPSVDETPKQTTVRNRRKTIVQMNEEPASTVSEKSSHSNRRKTIVQDVEDSGTTARTGRTRRSTMILNATTKENQSSLTEKTDLKQVEDTNHATVLSNRRKTIIADKDPVHTPVAISVANKRSRRKTIAFGNEENTPPLSAISMDITKTLSKTPKIPARETICSPKDMDMTSVHSKNQTNTRATNDLTKVNSNGTVISISSEEGNHHRQVPNRRRTLFIPSVESAMDGMVQDLNGTVRSSVGSSAANRHKTIFLSTPKNSTPMEPLEVTETPPPVSSQSHVTHADGSSIVNRPNPTSSSTPIPTTPVPTPATNGRKTLLEQYQDSLTFSSTRAPERRRRTVFDITMDIVDHRLSEINRQAAAVAASATKKPAVNNPVAVVASAEAALKSPPSQPDHQTSLDAYYRKAAKSCEKATQNAAVTPTTEATAPRKRKLFNVQTSVDDVPAVIAKPAPKRRSLAPGAAATTVEANKRRRTTTLFASPNDPTAAASQRTEKEEQKKKLFPIGRGLPTMASQYTVGGGGGASSQLTGPRQYLATTNLHTEQSTFVKEAIARLDGFIVEATVTDNTTHLVTLESRRTINLLRALIRGLWIVRYEWIVESFRAGRWLPEERYELSDFSRAVQLNRSERQAFGSQYRNELYTDYAPFWISPRCPIPGQQLRELILLCRGKVTGSAARAKFLVVDPNDNDAAPIEGQIVVSPVWILDSITVNKVKKLSKKYRVE
ncbi:mediator of DNA damage checkpoint protein 1 [Anopheles maculipalpis]|uniref:mediator of DNA damage checkpoint protein 1 n=1 Tax=Anopheles maculipalpis TaxID=1496333 RepID=UPI002158D7F6|nr:mediator of DNA damage checkpoint protein 1 [Anopheles maculipalpis]